MNKINWNKCDKDIIEMNITGPNYWGGPRQYGACRQRFLSELYSGLSYDKRKKTKNNLFNYGVFQTKLEPHQFYLLKD